MANVITDSNNNDNNIHIAAFSSPMVDHTMLSFFKHAINSLTSLTPLRSFPLYSYLSLLPRYACRLHKHSPTLFP